MSNHGSSQMLSCKRNTVQNKSHSAFLVKVSCNKGGHYCFRSYYMVQHTYRMISLYTRSFTVPMYIDICYKSLLLPVSAVPYFCGLVFRTSGHPLIRWAPTNTPYLNSTKPSNTSKLHIMVVCYYKHVSYCMY